MPVYLRPSSSKECSRLACWDDLAEICGNILRAAEFQGAARFRGNMVLYNITFKVEQLKVTI